MALHALWKRLLCSISRKDSEGANYVSSELLYINGDFAYGQESCSKIYDEVMVNRNGL